MKKSILNFTGFAMFASCRPDWRKAENAWLYPAYFKEVPSKGYEGIDKKAISMLRMGKRNFVRPEEVYEDYYLLPEAHKKAVSHLRLGKKSYGVGEEASK